MTSRIGDPLDDFARREHEQEEWLKSRPKCSYCGHHIQDERLMNIDGECYHIDCAEKVFGADTEGFAE